MIKISENEIIKRLKFDNPWWNDDGDIGTKVKNYPRRMYFNPFFELIKNEEINRAVILMGPRRVGKTIMAFHAIQTLLESNVIGKNILYISLETPLYSGLSLEQTLNLFISNFEHDRNTRLFVFFDEIQYLKDWEIHLKSLVDSYPNYKFVATGSAAAALRMKSRESGAGRFTDFLLPPLTFAEYIQFINKTDELIIFSPADDINDSNTYTAINIDELNKEFINYLNFGGYPEAVFSKALQEDSGRYIKSDIIDKVLLRDLPSLYGISDIQELNRLFTTLAYNSGNEVSLESLSQSAGVAKNTLKRYLEYLEAAFLIRCVKRVDQNSKHFKRATCFKVYLTNPSMRAALFGNIDEDSEHMGALTETAIFSQWLHSTTIDNLYYSRWDKGEVDIVFLNQKSQKPQWIVEVKWSDRPITDKSLLDNCINFIKKSNLQSKSALVTTKSQSCEIQYKDVNFRLRPSSEYTYTVGMNLLSNKIIKANKAQQNLDFEKD